MKKLLLLAFAAILLFGCKPTEEEKKSALTAEQQETIKVFYGTFKYNYSVGNDYITIKFLDKYDPPKKYDVTDFYGNKSAVSIYGDFEYYSSIGNKTEKYAYWLKSNGLDMSLYTYTNNGSVTKSRMQYERVVVIDNNTLRIFDKDLTLPLIFKRQ